MTTALTLPRSAPVTPPATPPATARDASLGTALLDARTMVGRELRRSIRSIDALLTALVLPVVILTMFVFVFGGAIDPGGHYIDYVVPGIILLCAGFGAAGTAVSVAQDREHGTIDRFATMPILGSAVLIGHVTASIVRNLAASTLVVGFALLYGYRPAAGPLGYLGAIALLVLFVLAITWLSCAAGLVVGAEAANGITFLMIFLPYVSSGFVPTATMPVVLHAFAEHQPLTPIIETMRSLLTGGGPGGEAWLAATWCLALAVAGYALSTALHRRRP